MCVIVGVSTREVDDIKAYFFCPGCRTRRPCTHGTRGLYFTLFFAPLFPLGAMTEYYRCEVCRQAFDPDARFPYDFGDHPEPKRWKCQNCGSANPSHSFRCKSCGAEA